MKRRHEPHESNIITTKMKITLIAVVSLDGYITAGDDANIYNWTSKEDTIMFTKRIEEASLVLMGAKTFGHARHFMKSKEGRTRVVFTRNTKKYQGEVIPGFLEFTSELPLDVIKRFEEKGIKEALLVGGSELQTAFLKAKLVDEISLTIEPIIFGAGKKLVSEEMNIKLEILSFEKLNETGTVMLQYKVLM